MPEALQPTAANTERFWLLALICGVGGVVGLADLPHAGLVEAVLLVAPHAAGVAVAAWAGRRGHIATGIAIAGSVVMAGLSWADAANRQTAGFEWRFNNGLSELLAGAANYGVLSLVILATMCLSEPPQPIAERNSGRRGGW